jgi:hypothetical protein
MIPSPQDNALSTTLTDEEYARQLHAEEVAQAQARSLHAPQRGGVKLGGGMNTNLNMDMDAIRKALLDAGMADDPAVLDQIINSRQFAEDVSEWPPTCIFDQEGCDDQHLRNEGVWQALSPLVC